MPLSGRLTRPLIRRIAALALLSLAALWLARFLRSPELAAWLRDNTGEESWWEGVKGAGALAILEVTQDRPRLEPDRPSDHLGVNPYGVNTFVQLEADRDNVRRTFAMLRDAGIGWARQQFPWEDIEIHGRGDFQDRRNEPPRSAWDKYDNIVRTAVDHGVQLLVRLDDPPEWVYADPEAEGAQKGPPDDLEDFGNFVAAVVKRYCGQVRYYQIWNEPNIYPEWGGTDAAPAPVDPAGYAALLRVAADRARGACPGVAIVSAALAPTTEPGGRNMHDLRYLDALYAAGWRDDFDVLAAQAFGLWTGPTDHRASPDRTNFSRVMLLRDIMVHHDDADKAVWITEMGWDSPPEAMPAPYGRVSEARRAEYTQAAYRRIAEEWPWVGVANLWFFRRPDWEWHTRPEGYFRLVEPSWRETETFLALAGLATRYPVLRRGRHNPDDVALVYNGPWRDEPEAGPPRQKVGAAGAEVQLSFAGTGIEVNLGRPPVRMEAAPQAVRAIPTGTASAAGATVSPGDRPADEQPPGDEPAPDAEEPMGVAPDLYVVLDGEAKSLTPGPSEDGFVFTHADLTGRAGDMDDTEHFVILRVDAGEAWLDDILVRAPDPPAPFDPVVRLVARLLAMAIAAALLAVLGRWAWWRYGRMVAGARGTVEAEGANSGAVDPDATE